MRYFYRRNPRGHAEFRRCQEHEYHPADLHPPGHIHEGKPKIGPWPLPVVKADDEIEFDRELNEVEIETYFPGHQEAIDKADRVAKLRHAITMAAHDDEVGLCFDNEILKIQDISDLREINERRKLRRMPIIGGLT